MSRKNIAIMVAAGLGKRLGSDIPKALVEINGISILERALFTVLQSTLFQSIFVTFTPGYEDSFQRACDRVNNNQQRITLIEGADTRQESVYKVLCSPEFGEVKAGDDIVLIHDAARCFASEDLFHRAMAGAEEHGAVTTGIPLRDTIKRVNPKSRLVVETLSRDDVWLIQTPQAFRCSVLTQAYEKVFVRQQLVNFSDDAGIVEELFPVAVIHGESSNIKVTYPQDIS